MSSKEGSQISPAIYLVGLGRVGSVITRKFIDFNPQIFQYVTTLERAHKTGLGIEVEIIDMHLEPEIIELLEKKILRKGDNVIHLVTQADAYSLDNIRQFGEFYMPRLLKYLAMIHENIRGLSQGSGVFRYRPLARYFIYHNTPGGLEHPFINILFSDIRSDIDEDLKPLNPQFIVELYILSLGGGFGSGSFIDIASFVDYMMREHFRGKHRVKLFLLTLPVGFERRPRSEDLVLNRLEESQASAAAALLELLYILNRSLIDGYEDSLTKIVTSTMGLSRDYKIKFDPDATIGLILSSYRRISGTDIEDIYRNFDEQTAIALTVLLQEILKKIYEKDIQGDRAYFPSYREIADKLRMPRELLYPVATYGVEVIKLDLTPLLKSSIAELNNEKKLRESALDALKHELERERAEVNALNECKERLVKALESIDAWKEEGAKLDADLLNKLNEIETKIREIRIYVENAGTSLSSRQYKESQRGLSSAIQRLAVLEGDVEALVNEMRDICRDIKNATERHRKVVDLIKHVNAEGVSEIKHRIDEIVNGVNNMSDIVMRLGRLSALLDKLHEIEAPLEGIKTLLSKIVDQASRECSILNRGACKVRDNGEQLMDSMENLRNKIEGTYDSVSRLKQQYEDLINELKNEINKAIAKLESALSKRIDSIRSKSRELGRAEERVKELVNNMNVERIKVLRDLIAKNTFLPEKVANYIIDLALEKGIEEVKNLTISRLYSEFQKVDAGLAEQLLDNIVARLRMFLNSSEYRVSFVELPFLERKLGIGKITQHKYILLSNDEAGLAEHLKRRLSGVEVFVSPTLRGSYVAAVRFVFGIPLIAVNEFRDLIHKYAVRMTRRVYKVVKKDEEWYDIEGEEYVEEYRGEAFHVLELDDDARRYIEEVINAVMQFDREVRRLSRRR